MPVFYFARRTCFFMTTISSDKRKTNMIWQSSCTSFPRKISPPHHETLIFPGDFCPPRCVLYSWSQGVGFSLWLLSEQWNATSTAAPKLIPKCMYWRTQSLITMPAAPLWPCKAVIYPTETFSSNSYSLFERRGKNLPSTVLHDFILHIHEYRKYKKLS